jgi:hypothetical protein
MAAPAVAQDHGQHGAQHGGQAHAAPQAAAAHDEHAGEADKAAVMAIVNRMFEALTAKNGAALLAEVAPEGRATATVAGPTHRVSIMPWPDFAAHLAQIPGRPVERLIDPHVHVEGDIAMIWSRYEFEMDGRFLHCGVDHFDLVRQDGRWRVLNLTWTQQTQGCPGR